LIYPFIYLINKARKKTGDFAEFILKTPLILAGMVSLVGPRDINKDSNIYLGKKGLTGLWYIEDFAGIDTDKLNIFYARNQSLWFDLEILGKTLLKMWNRK
jgi:lipopolysaccharide/colanic/teichoic acid biosynthesis glycosyltransferase